MPLLGETQGAAHDDALSCHRGKTLGELTDRQRDALRIEINERRMDMTADNTSIPSWEKQLDELEEKLKELAMQRDRFKTLYEHAQRELALALMKLEELQGVKDDEPEEY